jgi:hypothetical protein
MLARLVTKNSGTGDFAVAADGTLVYVDVPGGFSAARTRTLMWVDRTGKEAPVATPPRVYQHPRLSPDGTRVALAISDQENDLWIWDVRRATLTNLTLDPGQDFFRCGRRTAGGSFSARTARMPPISISGGRRPTAPAPPSGSPRAALPSLSPRSRRMGPRSCSTK